ncbi:F0F1-type ATP synthase membrane subunit c/vacuolar-type H+-ATPase subunit K [Bradyrhizobium elkanii]|jgi:F0F1-type ATP synthase membrane subunit c/vacuolar-type H+-ATPase subunit K|nr:F0F1-type ATP synthase membrane subunit c/vacuolar-type H+-ATPase subunit K [Bradyrhizobium elkanii]MCW2152773.1 F0F1-type ATP synthase membrane subunit c/vacuolar-type H+-ATPase subunit K [Bradyrhizobium elkanii]
MFKQPRFHSYSTPARICIGIAVLGAALLVGIILTHVVP